MKKSTFLIFTLIFLFNLTGTGNNKHSKLSQFQSYNGLVMCGYQGWFRAEGDGSNTGWGHYGIKGKFYWNLISTAINCGSKMLYVAMFDEIDEGTAIFKCTNQTPMNNGEARFVDYEGVPSDHYLWLTGKAAELIKNASPFPKEMPKPK